MHHRLFRVTLLIALIAVGVGEAWLFWNAQQQSAATLARDQDLDRQLDRMLADVAELGGAQQAYVVPGQFDGPWLALVSPLADKLNGDAAGVRAGARSTGAAATLQAFVAGLDALMKVDGRLRDDLMRGDQETAATLLFSEARDRLIDMNKSLEALRVAERSFRNADARARVTKQMSMLGGAALIWLVGLLLLVRVPRATAAASLTNPTHSGEATVPNAAHPEVAPDAVRSISSEASPGTSLGGLRSISPDSRELPPIDLLRAAEVCKDLARVGDAADLPAVLARAAGVLDASGIIIWLGAGEQLFAAASHGYDARVLARLGAINRGAENATAAAWRDARLHTVAGESDLGDTAAGPVATNGAIVAPMIGPDGCRGVLAVEVRHGREGDTAARAVASMFASQLAVVITAWPAASAAPSPATQADERAS